MRLPNSKSKKVWFSWLTLSINTRQKWQLFSLTDGSDQGRWDPNRQIVLVHSWDDGEVIVHRSPDVWSASGPAKNWTYKGVELTSMHFTVINPHLGLFGPSKFWTYIQNWTYNHGTYNRAPVYTDWRIEPKQHFGPPGCRSLALCLPPVAGYFRCYLRLGLWKLVSFFYGRQSMDGKGFTQYMRS